MLVEHKVEWLDIGTNHARLAVYDCPVHRARLDERHIMGSVTYDIPCVCVLVVELLGRKTLQERQHRIVRGCLHEVHQSVVCSLLPLHEQGAKRLLRPHGRTYDLRGLGHLIH